MGDPFVPIAGDRVRAAITELRGISINQAAKELGWKQQTLDSLVNGRQRRCRESRRNAIAKLVGLDGEYLSGNRVFSGHWHYFLHAFDETGLKAIGLPSRAEFALLRLERCVQAAVRRDAIAGVLPSGPFPRIAPPKEDKFEFLFSDPDEPIQRVDALVRLIATYFTSLHVWRTFCFTETLERQSDLDWDAFVVPLVQAVEVALHPWFDGEAPLDYARILSLTEPLQHTARGEPHRSIELQES